MENITDVRHMKQIKTRELQSWHVHYAHAVAEHDMTFSGL